MPVERVESDVVVIGAGPAGSTAARLLASWGHSAVLIGRAPSRKSLGESLPSSCTKLFDQLGIRRTVDGAGFMRATGNTVRWAAGETRVERFETGMTGYQVDRGELDAVLLAAAKIHTLLKSYEATVVDVARDPTSAETAWRVTFETNEGRSTIHARWVLDCSGRAGVVARHGWRRAEPGGRTMAVAAIWERNGPWPVVDNSHTLVESYDGGWAWSVPISAARRFVTVMLDPELTRVPGRTQLAESYMAELARTTMLRDLVASAGSAGASLIDTPWGLDASPYSATRVFDDGILLVGDAASFVDPLSSFGVKKALASAWLASVVVHSAIGSPALTSAALELFANRERAMFEQLQRQSSLLSRDAAAAHPTEFWASRSDVGVDGGDTFSDMDVGSLRADPRVQAAFEDLKRLPRVQLRTSQSTRVVERALVRGNRIALEAHLATPELHSGVRYCRNVDLVRLSELAPRYDQVPDLYDAYNAYSAHNSTAMAAPLPDFLGALSTLIGFGILTFAD